MVAGVSHIETSRIFGHLPTSGTTACRGERFASRAHLRCIFVWSVVGPAWIAMQVRKSDPHGMDTNSALEPLTHAAC